MTSHLTDELAAAIAATDGNAMRTARLLGVSHRAFMYWVSQDPMISLLVAEARAGRPQQSMEELLLAAPLGTITLRRYPTEWAVTTYGQTYRHASVHRALAEALAEK